MIIFLKTLFKNTLQTQQRNKCYKLKAQFINIICLTFTRQKASSFMLTFPAKL